MKKVVTVIMILGLVASTYVVSAKTQEAYEGAAEVVNEVTCEVTNEVSYPAVDEVNSKIDELLEQRAELREQYDKTRDIDIANKLLDIDYSIKWYGINTDARFYSEEVFKEKGLTGWVEGSVAYDAFTGEFISHSDPYEEATLDIFNY